MSAQLYTITALGGLLAGPVIALSSAAPETGEPVLVIALDPADRFDLITDAGGRIIGPEEAVFGSFAASDDPEFVQRLRSSGVWFVVDGRSIARLCGVEL